MPNPIKFTTGSETNALKKGNFAIGTGDVGKGPSSETGYYNGVEPTVGGWVVYLNRPGAPGNLEYRSLANNQELITYTNQLAGQNYTTVEQCLVYFSSQTDRVILNRDYEPIVTDGLILHLDAGFTPSYPTSGNSWYELIGGNNGTLVNGPIFDNNSLLFDGVNDYGTLDFNPGPWGQNSVSISVAVYPQFDGETYGRPIFTKNQSCVAGEWAIEYGRASLNNGTNRFSFNSNTFITSANTFPKDNWYIVTVSFNASNLSYALYVNGTLQGSGTGSSNISTANGIYGIGRFGGCYPTVVPWKGKIGFIQLYNRALSETEILQNWNAQKGRFGL